MITKSCLGIDCPERKSLCCGAGCTNGKKGEPHFVCKECRKEFQGGECTAGNSTPYEEQVVREFEEQFDRELFTTDDHQDIMIDVSSQKIKDFLLSALRQQKEELTHDHEILVNTILDTEKQKRAEILTEVMKYRCGKHKKLIKLLTNEK